MAERTILYCHCQYARVIPAETKDAVLDAIAASGQPFEAVPDLCEMSARKDPRLAELASRPGLRIAACYPRAVRWLFAGAGAALPQEGVEIRNMRSEDPGDVAAALLAPEGVDV